jgi:hypothetical protein
VKPFRKVTSENGVLPNKLITKGPEERTTERKMNTHRKK